jgi:iron complex outermembrane receptor protein
MSRPNIKNAALRVTRLVAVLLCIYDAAQGQQMRDSLKEVQIRDKRVLTGDTRTNDFSAGQKIQAIDSTTLHQYRLQSVAALLTQQVPVFVKSYSFNGLATLSFRGASAAQSQVLWNGIPIQNAALGVADVSAIPVSFMNNINIAYGGSGALYGSGNVGGALLLESDRPVYDTDYRQLFVSGGAGSFGQYQGGVKGALAGKKWYAAANTFLQTAKNNYSYTRTNGATAQMTNGELSSAAVMVQGAYKFNNRNTVELHGWYQDYDRHIPPALFETYSVKRQQDKSMRMLARWQYTGARYNVYARSSFIRDEINYSDTAVVVVTHNAVHQYYQEAGWKQQTGTNGQLLVFIPVQLSWLPEGNDSQRQNRIAVAAAYQIKLINTRLHLSVQARGEQINDQRIFLPGGGAAFHVRDWLWLRANVQRTYRMPSLNELYYFPGGNPRLKPERGWTQDAGYTLKAKKGQITLYHDLSIFNRNIQDWIMWLGGAVWTPQNIATVHSRGTETDTRITFGTGDWLLHFSAGTTYVLATTTASNIPGDGSTGKQIPYTPRYNGRVNVGCTWKRIYLNYNHTYTGYRFITTDESAWLLPYQSGNVQMMYSTTIRSRRLQLSLQYNNLWNEQYSVAGFRPMPPANWLAGMQLQLL